MFTWQKNSSEFIYHYTKADTAINFILKDQRLRFSSLLNTNDPKESKNWFLTPASNTEKDLSNYTPEILSEILHEHIKKSAQLICFSKDATLSGNHIEDTPKRGFCKPRMWDQYAARHKGVCLIFNFERLKTAFHEQYKNHTYAYESMSYIDRPLYDTQESPAFIINIDHLEKIGPKDYALAHIIEHKNRMFFEKAKDWENESEFRFMIFECKKEEYFLDYKDSLQGIVFGDSCSEQDISEVVSLTEGMSIQYQKLLWRNCTPWFDFSRNVWR